MNNIIKKIKRMWSDFLDEQADIDEIDALSGEPLRLANQDMETAIARIGQLAKVSSFSRPAPHQCNEFAVVRAEEDGSTMSGGEWSVVCNGYYVTSRFENLADADEMMRCLRDAEGSRIRAAKVVQKITEINWRIKDRKAAR